MKIVEFDSSHSAFLLSDGYKGIVASLWEGKKKVSITPPLLRALLQISEGLRKLSLKHNDELNLVFNVILPDCHVLQSFTN